MSIQLAEGQPKPAASQPPAEGEQAQVPGRPAPAAAARRPPPSSPGSPARLPAAGTPWMTVDSAGSTSSPRLSVGSCPVLLRVPENPKSGA